MALCEHSLSSLAGDAAFGVFLVDCSYGSGHCTVSQYHRGPYSCDISDSVGFLFLGFVAAFFGCGISVSGSAGLLGQLCVAFCAGID